MSSLVTSFVGTGVMGRNLAGHGGVVLGSERTGGIRNVFVKNWGMDSPGLDRALRFKNNAVRGGVSKTSLCAT